MKKETIPVESVRFSEALIKKVESAAKPVLYWHKQLRKPHSGNFFARLRYAYVYYRFNRAQIRYFNHLLTRKP
ncbi:hypothetical protein [Runella zeae]|uniref:hypothetical protein n=1 Tax=Runella zeae TaxID=94255 RepID=UPI00048F737D|nr:hypothetical protein [Runella zeae]